jgi:hypothetical protein
MPYCLSELLRQIDSIIKYQHVGTFYELIYIYFIGAIFWYRLYKKLGIDLANAEFEKKDLYGLIEIETLKVMCWELWFCVFSTQPFFLSIDISIQDTNSYYILWYKRGIYMFLFSTLQYIILEYIEVHKKLRLKYLNLLLE